MIYRSMKTKIYPNNKMNTLLTKWIGVARLTRNDCLAKLIKEHKSNKTLNYFGLNKWWNSIKHEKYPFVKDVSKHVQESKIWDLYNEFKKVYERKGQYPKFAVKNLHDNFKLNGSEILIDNKMLILPKGIKIKMGRPLRWDPIKLFSVTISKKANNWYASFKVGLKEKINYNAKGIIGVDIGISTLATLSNGEKFVNPKAEKMFRNKIAYLSRSLSKKQKYSRNWYKEKNRLANTHIKMANIRKDNIDKLTSNLSNRFDIIALEKLKVNELLKNNPLAKYIYDASFSEISKQLCYKANKIIYVSPYYPSSQICSNCKAINKQVKNLNIREWKCVKCGAVHDRDINAARNILVEANHKVKPVRNVSF